MVDLTPHSAAPFCYLTTTGRRTGRPHEIEIWFVLIDDVVFLLAGAGERSDWVRNLLADPHVTLRMGDYDGPAEARVVDDVGSDGNGTHPARRALAARYQGWQGDEAGLSEWARRSLLVAVVPG